MVNVLRASIKAAAVGGIFMALAKITIEAFNFSRRIISLEEDECDWLSERIHDLDARTEDLDDRICGLELKK